MLREKCGEQHDATCMNEIGDERKAVIVTANQQTGLSFEGTVSIIYLLNMMKAGNSARLATCSVKLNLHVHLHYYFQL